MLLKLIRPCIIAEILPAVETAPLAIEPNALQPPGRAIATAGLTRYTANMVSRYLTLCRTLVAAAILHAATGGVAIGGGIGVYYGVPFYVTPFALDMYYYYPWFGCAPLYGCRDPVQVRIELERDRRMQELRERATQREVRFDGPGDGPWGRQRYVPPATPEGNIQPAYRGTSQLRPEYEQFAQPLTEQASEQLK